MMFESFRQDLRSFTVFEWGVVVITVIAFVAITTTVGFVIGPMVGYAVVILHRRARREGAAGKAKIETTPAK